jgi:hypothetical protein
MGYSAPDNFANLLALKRDFEEFLGKSSNSYI